MPLYEVFCGFTSSLIVAPIMTIIDTAIIKSQLKNILLKTAISDSITDYSSKKIQFTKPFGTMFFVYSSTYITANLTDLYCKKNNIDYRIPTLVATSLANITTIAYKDREYAKLFQQERKVFPKSSYALFALRDSLTIASSFIYKKDCVNILQHYMPHNTADLIASMCVPMLAQLISTPIHIMAIDIYQRPSVSLHHRIKHIRNMYTSICGGRILRVIPAFCIGGFINDMLRERNEKN